MPDATMGAVPLRPEDDDAAGAVLGRAFQDDPHLHYLTVDESRRENAINWFNRRAVAIGRLYGETYATAGAIEGAAVWLPPGFGALKPMHMIKAGLWATPFKFGFASLGRLMAFTGVMEKLHERDMPGPHWYLMAIGIEPERQGQGLGGALLQPVLTKADRDQVPCYLETGKERNLPFYRRYGFTVVAEGDLPKGGPRYWTMRRPPQS